jgi:acetolactate synthase-1/2/3 large subunit
LPRQDLRVSSAPAITVKPNRDSHVRPVRGVEFEPDSSPANRDSGFFAVPDQNPRNEPLSAARRLVEALVMAGVDTFFGIPGGPVSPVFDAVLQTPGARLVESRHETGAAFAASGYYRASGRVPAVLVTAGPGATNAVTGIVSAHLERVPMLVVCGDVAWANGGRLLQDSGPAGIAIEEMLAKATRATIRVTQAKSAASQGLAALNAATDESNPGPALLVVPIQLGAAVTPLVRIESGRATRSFAPPREAVVEACELLAHAERPLLVLGAGCRSRAATIRRLVDVLDVPFVTTPRAKGIVSEEHPHSLRHGGLAASMWARKYTAAGVDAAVVLGTDLDDCSIGPTPYIADGGRLVHVDLDATVLNRNLPTALGVVADVGAFAEAMLDVVVERGLRNGRSARVLRELRAASPYDIATFASDDAVRLKPWRALGDLQQAAGEDARFVTDIGEHMLFALHYLTAKGPDAFTIHLGLGSMGSGICGAVGLALGDRSRRVVCVCGDGGMQMAGAEALVAVRERLPIVFAVFNDSRYNMVYHGYKYVFGREAAWDSPQIDFAMWARAMGMNAVRVHHPGEVTATLLDRLTMQGGPVVLDIRIDPDVRLSGGGRNEALQHMSMSAQKN